ncbi:MAG: hypothetical protein HBSAPP03_00180 [Phycisphaerae bacterium]|nr:MAG: hypothetical protein HBSAPP03_00180 [Phycisphaerae bacterium]
MEHTRIDALDRVWHAVGELPEGPLDIVGDVHGEIGALRALMTHLGYDEGGVHPRGRRLIFVGDLIDRGPDSPGVVRLVARTMAHGGALAVMGNHDFNAVIGRQRKENSWLFGHGPVQEGERRVTADAEREELLGVLRGFPVALHRPDLRVVHAYWDDAALARLRSEDDPVRAHVKHRDAIRARFEGRPDPIAMELALQNENPMKLVTSGPEYLAPAPFEAGGVVRTQQREAWWERYTDVPAVVFGHYWRIPVKAGPPIFAGYADTEWLGPSRAMCIDYSVGWRSQNRRSGSSGAELGRLAALRWPEAELVFDDGARKFVVPRAARV